VWGFAKGGVLGEGGNFFWGEGGVFFGGERGYLWGGGGGGHSHIKMMAVLVIPFKG